MSHDDGFHDKEAAPGQPEGMLLRDEGCSFESQDDGDAAVSDQVKAAGRGQQQEGEEEENGDIVKGEKVTEGTESLVEGHSSIQRLDCSHKH